MTGARREKQLHKEYYYKIIYQYPEYIPSKCEAIITADLKRTFPNDEYFKKPENKKKLKNILIAYSRRNSRIGYCQGFNFIVARLLRLFNTEEDVFWIFVQIIENILPCEYYSELLGIMTDCSSCLEILKETNKKIMKKLEGLEVVLNNLLYKWFISLFVENTSFDTFLNIWDALIIDGDIVLLRAVCAMLELYEDKILQCEDIQNLTMLFEEKMSKYNFPRDKFMALLLSDKLINIPHNRIEELKETASRVVIDNLIKTKKNEIKKMQLDINGVEIECDLDYPFCLKEFEDDASKNRNTRQIQLDIDDPNRPLTKEEVEKILKEEKIKDFKLKNIQLVQTFRSNNPIEFKSNYFQKFSELKEGPFIDEEEKVAKSRKLEAIFGMDPYHQQEKKEKDISVNEKLVEQVKVFQNLLIHRDEHLCRTNKRTSEKVLAQVNSNNNNNEEFSKLLTYKRNATKNFLLNVAKDVNENQITSIIGSVQKSFNSNSELELIADDENVNSQKSGNI